MAKEENRVLPLLERKRQELGLSQAALAALLGINAGYWSRVRCGQMPFRGRVVEGMLRVFPDLGPAYVAYVQALEHSGKAAV